MRFKTLHSWPRGLDDAIALQQQLAPWVRLAPVRANIRLITGADAAFTADGSRVVGAVVVWDQCTGELVEARIARAPCRFPYVAGLLSFRELPALLAVFRQIRRTPDVVLCDGQGLAHPRRLGIASHLGLWLKIPIVGCAKSWLLGEYEEPPAERGGASPLRDAGAQVGVVLRTRAYVKPIFVSPGHLCDHASAARIALAAARYRIPEPLRLAHQLATGALARWPAPSNR